MSFFFFTSTAKVFIVSIVKWHKSLCLAVLLLYLPNLGLFVVIITGIIKKSTLREFGCVVPEGHSLHTSSNQKIQKIHLALCRVTFWVQKKRLWVHTSGRWYATVLGDKVTVCHHGPTYFWWEFTALMSAMLLLCIIIIHLLTLAFQ